MLNTQIIPGTPGIGRPWLKVDDLERLFQENGIALQMLPQVATHALELVQDPSCDVREFVAVVERDVRLAGEMLRLANSAAFTTSIKPVVSLHQAVTKLGFCQAKSVIISYAVASLMKKLPLKQEWVRSLLWQHSIATGLFALQLNRTLGLGYGGEEYTLGLIHDLGRILLAAVLPDEFSELDPLDFEETEETPSQEQAGLGISHCDVGHWFAQQNALPEAICAAIVHHHAPQNAGPHAPLTALIAAADHMANHFQKHGEGKGYAPEGNLGLELLERVSWKPVLRVFHARQEEIFRHVETLIAGLDQL